MSVPNELPDIGSTAQRLRQNPRFDPVAAGVGPEDYFVWTRFDGATTVKDLILMTGFALPKALEIVRRLRTMGAILLPNEKPEAVASRIKSAVPVAAPARAPSGPTRRRTETDDDDRPTTRVSTSSFKDLAPPSRPTTEPPATAVETAALAEDVELSADERARILAMHRRIQSGDPLAILAVPDGSDKKAIKRAYFGLSKEFHPDRFYGKRTGSYARRLDEVFEAVSTAYAQLNSDGAKRAKNPTQQASSPQSPADYAIELFDRACQAEVSGDHAGALQLFASALRIEPSPRYLRRAARCAVSAGELRVALEYAKKAAVLEPNDASTSRLLAAVFKAAGRLSDAEEVLVMALMLRNDNDQLGHEIQADLAEIRRLAAR